MNIHNFEQSIKSEESQIMLLQQKQIPSAAKMMADTFFHDPLACYLIPNECDRLEFLEKVWVTTLKHDFIHGHLYTSYQENSHDSQILGIASWLPPNTKSPSLFQSFPLIFEVLLKHGWTCTNRILAALTKTDDYRHRDCPISHWYLDGLAVSPNTQGKGIGGLLLQPVLQQADLQGEMCYLFTSTPRAVKFYQRHGFVVRNELRILSDAPVLWMMMRSPQS